MNRHEMTPSSGLITGLKMFTALRREMWRKLHVFTAVFGTDRRLATSLWANEPFRPSQPSPSCLTAPHRHGGVSGYSLVLGRNWITLCFPCMFTSIQMLLLVFLIRTAPPIGAVGICCAAFLHQVYNQLLRVCGRRWEVDIVQALEDLLKEQSNISVPELSRSVTTHRSGFVLMLDSSFNHSWIFSSTLLILVSFWEALSSLILNM